MLQLTVPQWSERYRRQHLGRFARRVLAFIQCAGFTKGKAVSQFDAPCSSRASQQETVKTWGFRGAYTHNWDPYWNTAIYGAYALAQFGTLAKTTPESSPRPL
jgi:Porin subfamily